MLESSVVMQSMIMFFEVENFHFNFYLSIEYDRLAVYMMISAQVGIF